jgi:hypothetical protein
MKCILLTAIIGIQCQTAFGGPITDEFRGGYGGIPWGTSLVNLVGTLPGGQHFFAVTSTAGERLYKVANDEPLMGVPRQGMNVDYGLGKWNTVDVVGINVPYERRDELLGVLISRFGNYSKRIQVGASTYYEWPQEICLRMSLRASTAPNYGILQFVISNPPACLLNGGGVPQSRP